MSNVHPTARNKTTRLLEDSTSTGAGATNRFPGERASAQIIATGGTVSGTVAIQVSNDGSTWYAISTEAFTTADNVMVDIVGKYKWIRANQTIHSNGTFNVYMYE